MIVIGLTGSIGMGKSTTAALFADEGVATFDSDAAVHRLYENEAVPSIEKAFPGVTEAGRVDRQKLGDTLRANPANFTVLEKVVHPLVQHKQREFLEEQSKMHAEFALLDIPLLYETGAEKRVDTVVVVSCATEIQRERILSRPGMTAEKLDMILSRQMPDVEKRRRADFVIDTGQGIENARKQVQSVLADLKAGKKGRQGDA